MERKARWLWWGFLVVLLIAAAWKLFLPHSTKAYLYGPSGGREIVVYVAGAVDKPSLLHLPLEARLADALKQIRPLPDANLDALNPAEKLKDGQKITVPFRPGVAEAPGIPGGGAGTKEGGSVGSATGQVSGAGTTGTTGATGTTGKININTAGAGELDKLPGIGPALAQRILQYRTEHGPFARPEDLQEVAGIGPKTYAKMAAMVMVGP